MEPPADLDAERAVLGAVLLDNSRLPLVRGIVGADDFHDPRNATVWVAIERLAAEDEPIDVVTLANAIRDDGKLNAIGGAQYLGELTDTIPTIAHVESHASIVARLGARRAMLHAAKAATEAALHGDDLTAASLLRAASDKADDKRRALRPVSMEAGLLASFDALEARAESDGRDPNARPTGLEALDDALCGGALPGQNVVIAARPGVGKTALAVTVCIQAARWAKARAATWPVLFFSIEMPTRELYDRFLLVESGVDGERMKRGVVSGDDMRRLITAGDGLHDLAVEVFAVATITLRALLAECRRYHAKHGGLAAVVVDYLQLVDASRRDGSREREIGDISRAMKAAAKEFDCPFYTLAQLNRESEKGSTPQRPNLANLRESGSIEQDADVVLLIHREEQSLKTRGQPVPDDKRGGAEVIIAKLRNGEARTVQARYEGHCYRFTAPSVIPKEGVVPTSYLDATETMEGFPEYD